MLEDLPRQRDVDGADLLARVALRAQRVGQVGLLEPVMKWRQHEPDRSVVDVPELMPAHRHERRARVGASTAPDACEGVAKHRIGKHVRAAVVEDHAMHLFGSVHADRQRLLDVGGARRAGDPVHIAGHDLAGAAAGQHAQHCDRIVEGCNHLVDAEDRNVNWRQRGREVGIAFVGDEHDRPRLRDGHVGPADADRG